MRSLGVEEGLIKMFSNTIWNKVKFGRREEKKTKSNSVPPQKEKKS